VLDDRRDTAHPARPDQLSNSRPEWRAPRRDGQDMTPGSAFERSAFPGGQAAEDAVIDTDLECHCRRDPVLCSCDRFFGQIAFSVGGLS